MVVGWGWLASNNRLLGGAHETLWSLGGALRWLSQGHWAQRRVHK